MLGIKTYPPTAEGEPYTVWMAPCEDLQRDSLFRANLIGTGDSEQTALWSAEEAIEGLLSRVRNTLAEISPASKATVPELLQKGLIRANAEKDPNYCPYCLTCPGTQRMSLTPTRFLWECTTCHAVHDERTDVERQADTPLVK